MASDSTTDSRPKVARLDRNATPAERQAWALAKLLANPEREIVIPERPEDGVGWSIRAPRETMRNVQGSSAGAGSGEFHVYKQSRRREYERLKLMDEEDAYAKTKAAAEQRQAEYEATAEHKTAKNRLKRQRKKAHRGKHSKDGDDSADEGPTSLTPAEAADKKRKLGGGGASGMRFKAAGERGDSDDEAGPVGATAGELAAVAAAQEEEEVKAAKEAGIVIRDED